MTLDVTRIEQLLAASLPGARDASISEPERVFGGNARQAWAFDVTWRHAQGSSDVSAIMLAQVEPGQLEANPEREFGVLRGLEGSGTRAPAALAADPAGDVLGFPAIVLGRMPGAAGLTDFLEPDDPSHSRALTEDLAVATAELHAADPAPTGLGTGTSARAAAEAVTGDWRRQFETAAYEPHPVLAALFGWLEEHLPEPPSLTVVHGDLRPGNFLSEGGRITALLDWEMAHIGDPAEDLAWIYRPLWSPEPFLALHAFLARYNEHAAEPVTAERLRYWRVFSELKFATISLRAARAFHDGRSGNLRLADRAVMTTACARRALEWTAEPVRA